MHSTILTVQLVVCIFFSIECVYRSLDVKLWCTVSGDDDNKDRGDLLKSSINSAIHFVRKEEEEKSVVQTNEQPELLSIAKFVTRSKKYKLKKWRRKNDFQIKLRRKSVQSVVKSVVD